MEYVAIDFETANTDSDSACSIGLVRFDEEGERLDSYYSLIKPPILFFDPLCTSIHHLKSEDLIKAPHFDEIWSDVKAFIGTSPLVAHNAQFDMRVLSSTLKHYMLDVPKYKYYCTFSLSRKLWKDKESYSLTALASGFGWTYDAHNALSDAETCGRLFSRLCGENLFDEEILDRFFHRVYKTNSKPFPRILKE